MRKVLECEPIKDSAGKTFGVKDFIEYIVGHSAHFTQNYDAIERAERVMKELNKLTFSEGDWEMLCTASKNPTCAYPITPAYVCRPLIKSILVAEMLAD